MSDKTPKVDELEKGPWPSYVKEIKRAAKKNAAAKDLLGVQELSFNDRVTHWKHGGIVRGHWLWRRRHRAIQRCPG
jgi:dissimilatory sulfite reductase alpha subunit